MSRLWYFGLLVALLVLPDASASATTSVRRHRLHRHGHLRHHVRGNEADLELANLEALLSVLQFLDELPEKELTPAFAFELLGSGGYFEAEDCPTQSIEMKGVDSLVGNAFKLGQKIGAKLRNLQKVDSNDDNDALTKLQSDFEKFVKDNVIDPTECKAMVNGGTNSAPSKFLEQSSEVASAAAVGLNFVPISDFFRRMLSNYWFNAPASVGVRYTDNHLNCVGGTAIGSYCAETAVATGCEALFQGDAGGEKPLYGYRNPNVRDVCVKYLDGGNDVPLYYSRYDTVLRRPMWVAFKVRKGLTLAPGVQGVDRAGYWFASMPGVENPTPAVRRHLVFAAWNWPTFAQNKLNALWTALTTANTGNAGVLHARCVSMLGTVQNDFLDSIKERFQEGQGYNTLRNLIIACVDTAGNLPNGPWPRNTNPIWLDAVNTFLPNTAPNDVTNLLDVDLSAKLRKLAALFVCSDAYTTHLTTLYNDANTAIENAGGAPNALAAALNGFTAAPNGFTAAPLYAFDTAQAFADSICLAGLPTVANQRLRTNNVIINIANAMINAHVLNANGNAMAMNDLTHAAFTARWPHGAAPPTLRLNDLTGAAGLWAQLAAANPSPVVAITYADNLSRGHLSGLAMQGGGNDPNLLRGIATFGMTNMAINFAGFDGITWGNVERDIRTAIDAANANTEWQVVTGTSAETGAVETVKTLVQRDSVNPITDDYSVPLHMFAWLRNANGDGRLWFCDQDPTGANNQCRELDTNTVPTKAAVLRRLRVADNELI